MRTQNGGNEIRCRFVEISRRRCRRLRSPLRKTSLSPFSPMASQSLRRTPLVKVSLSTTTFLPLPFPLSLSLLFSLSLYLWFVDLEVSSPAKPESCFQVLDLFISDLSSANPRSNRLPTRGFFFIHLSFCSVPGFRLVF